jgi:hypothetical protein
MNVNLVGPPTPNSYGLAVGPTQYGPLGVISSPEQSHFGNIVFHVGHEIPEGGWTKSEHVVLTPPEAGAVVGQVLELLDPPAQNHSTDDGPAVCILPDGTIHTFGVVTFLVGAAAQLYLEEELADDLD